MRIRIIASKPKERQGGIDGLIGREFLADAPAWHSLNSAGAVSIIHDGRIHIINRDEYEVIEP